jgi:hypothetical protein
LQLDCNSFSSLHFWDKLQALFVHDAKVRWNPNPGK